jgi:hypothetical protein
LDLSGEKAMNNSQDVWNRMVTSYKAYLEATRNFLSNDLDRVSLLKKALRGPESLTAIHLLKFLKREELQQLFEELVFLASFSHGAVGVIREMIKSLPNEWVITHIEEVAEPLLVNGTYDEYRRLLELYVEIDTELTKHLAQRAIQSTDLDIREAGEDFLRRIGL